MESEHHKNFCQDSVLSQYNKQVEESTHHLSEGDLEEKKALTLEDKAPSLINKDSKVHMKI